MLIRYFLCMKRYELYHSLWRIFVAVGVIVINISCGNDLNVKIAKLQSVKVTLPIDKMVSVKNGEIKKIDHALEDKPRFIHYIDSSECTICAMKALYLWDDLIVDKEYYKKISFYFIIEPNNNLSELISALNSNYFSQTVFFDVDHIFYKENPDLNIKGLNHCYLLDKRNRIVLLGNPITNNAIYKLFSDVVNNMLAHDGVYVPDEKN